MAGDFTTREEVLGVYRKRARHYDLTANSYYLLGFREWTYRKRAIAALGCGLATRWSRSAAAPV